MGDRNRKQLTLFVNRKDAGPIEQIRQQFNPIQFELIPAHVTLCREDEIVDLERVIANLAKIKQAGIELSFGPAVRFQEGKGVLLPAISGIPEFDALRRRVLEGVIQNPRKQEPHITLMHPRNSTCTDGIFADIRSKVFPSILKFSTISIIEQKNGGKWDILQEFVYSD